MIMFVVGATGAIGRPLIKQLVAAGHEVIGTTRSAGRLNSFVLPALRPRSLTPATLMLYAARS
jgi:nucleoside-diphosphate-sugar epimerase